MTDVLDTSQVSSQRTVFQGMRPNIYQWAVGVVRFILTCNLMKEM